MARAPAAAHLGAAHAPEGRGRIGVLAGAGERAAGGERGCVREGPGESGGNREPSRRSRGAEAGLRGRRATGKPWRRSGFLWVGEVAERGPVRRRGGP